MLPNNASHVPDVLAKYLSNSGEFAYSLMLPTRDEDADPIEDFVIHNRTGHCEYFASALALMLRSQNIPSRIVMGYKTAEYNHVGKYFQVRQLHAHAWTEAYLEPQQIPAHLKIPGHDYSHGAWLTLDATPTDAIALLVDEENEIWASIKNIVDHIDLLWHDYMVRYNSKRQQQLIYKPLSQEASSLAAQIYRGRWISEALRAIWQPIATEGWNLMSVLQSLATLLYYLMFLVPIVFVLHFVLSWALPSVRHMLAIFSARSGDSSQKMVPSEIDFYRRFEQIVSRHGLASQRGRDPARIRHVDPWPDRRKPRFTSGCSCARHGGRCLLSRPFRKTAARPGAIRVDSPGIVRFRAGSRPGRTSRAALDRLTFIASPGSEWLVLTASR